MKLKRIKTKDKSMGIWYLCGGGQGNFLDPPGYPTHFYHFEMFSRNGKSFLASASLFVEGLPEEVRKEAKKLLENTELKLEKDWVYQVLGYFRDCYSPDGVDFSADNCIVDEKRNPIEWQDYHLGVHHIRKYFPEYELTEEDLKNAYWGTKKK